MSHFSTLLNLACGQPPLDDHAAGAPSGRARRLHVVISALLCSLCFSAVWGLAAGSRVPALAVANTYKLPVVVLLSAASAVPAGLLAWKLFSGKGRATDLLVGFAAGMLSGTLVLAVLAPLLALYYHSSAWAGPLLGQGSVVLAVVVGTGVFLRTSFRLAPRDVPRRTLALPASVLVALHLAALLQLISLTSPILPERTVFDRGIDHVAGRLPAR